ncbi:MAG: hypothetical protein NVS1B10_02490 [Candidatus Saccharimonadales bacterium]
MSKYLDLSKQSEIDDGKFEIIAFRRRNKLRLIPQLLKATTRGLNATNQRKKYSFKTTHTLLAQLDGEIVTIDANTSVIITNEPRLLSSLA